MSFIHFEFVELEECAVHEERTLIKTKKKEEQEFKGKPPFVFLCYSFLVTCCFQGDDELVGVALVVLFCFFFIAMQLTMRKGQ